MRAQFPKLDACLGLVSLVGFVDDPPSRGEVKRLQAYIVISDDSISALFWLKKIKKNINCFHICIYARIDAYMRAYMHICAHKL